MQAFEHLLPSGALASPWLYDDRLGPHYQADLALLESLLALPLRTGSSSESGQLAKGIDTWLAHELRRSGFPEDEVYPRRIQPRVLPREVGLLLQQLPKELREEVSQRLKRSSAVAPGSGRILGRVYFKQVDVFMAQWARGPEILISTKSMVSSFRNNLPNRFEESYGDAKNLRGRHPLAAMGFFFLLRSTILTDEGAFNKAVDMLRKLRSEADVYDATCLVVAEWDDSPTTPVKVLVDAVPADLHPSLFLSTIVDKVLERTPVDVHVLVRELRDQTHIGLEEEH